MTDGAHIPTREELEDFWNSPDLFDEIPVEDLLTSDFFDYNHIHDAVLTEDE